MNKKIITQIYCDNEWQEEPSSCLVVIDEETAKEILRLAEVVRENNVYGLQKFDYSARFSNVVLDFVLDDDKKFEEVEKEILDAEEVRTECDMLEVQKNHFKWTAYLKHGSSDTSFSSQLIHIDFLTDDNETLMVTE